MGIGLDSVGVLFIDPVMSDVCGSIGGARTRVCSFLGSAFGAKVQKCGERRAELAFEAGFVAVQQIEHVGFIAHGAEGDKREGRIVLAFVTARATDFLVEPGGLAVPDALLTPAGDGHSFDEIALGGGFGLVLVEERGEQGAKFFLRFAGEDDFFREEAVGSAVLRGGVFALFGDGAAGFCAVGAGCDLLEFGRHKVI